MFVFGSELFNVPGQYRKTESRLDPLTTILSFLYLSLLPLSSFLVFNLFLQPPSVCSSLQ